MTSISNPEPEPIKNTMPAIWPLVIKDMCDRHQIGCEKYGTPLQANNGRRPLVDAYQELLDLVVYLRQELVEREQLDAEVVRLRGEDELLRIHLAAYTGTANAARAAAALMPNITDSEEEWQPLSCMHDNPVEQVEQLDGQQIDAELRAAHHGPGATIPTVEEMGQIDDPERRQRIESLGFICGRRREQALDGVTT